MKTTLEKVLELLDAQMKIVEDSKKGKDAKYKYAADAAVTNLVMAKITFKGMLAEEQEMITDAYADGLNAHRTNFCNRDEYFKKKFGQRTAAR